MPAGYKKPDNFDLTLAKECARAFSDSTGLGCTISDTKGAPLYEVGYSCVSCEMCAAAKRSHANCASAHMYGMTEAERFGGKYIYFCPMGLTCFVSPIVGQTGSEAKITVGPFLMVGKEDYTALDLQQTHQLTPEKLQAALVVLKKIPFVSPKKVNSLSVLLFMAVGFMNNVSASNAMLDTQASDIIQGHINAYIGELKQEEDTPGYPLETERELLAKISESDKPEAQRLLNELLGYIFLSSGGLLLLIRTRLCELVALISRAAIDAGAPPTQSLYMNHEFFEKAQGIKNIDELCFLTSDVMNRFMDSVFLHVDIKHVDVIHKTIQHLRDHYAQKLTLEEMAQRVYLSPSYFSKVFKKEMGRNFNTYLNELRIEKSKTLLLKNNRLVDIATMVGFEDQSYFTKVFKRVTGVSPNRYRELGGRI